MIREDCSHFCLLRIRVLRQTYVFLSSGKGSDEMFSCEQNMQDVIEVCAQVLETPAEEEKLLPSGSSRFLCDLALISEGMCACIRADLKRAPKRASVLRQEAL